ncbi:hypothetical protein [Nonomuraea sp. NEAU-A123]|uniref:hypothetical protein n=1 Tax=Nonomuraea sp. NEAU-A123 TaxID=2839649 RepID=UPI001BE3F1D0|nr:hypothetical protein [Nonomuraea sp. NEAU-A123]MBT2233847.1 hypothetical protein [Nonomuraea sp. NEAU-A123]
MSETTTAPPPLPELTRVLIGPPGWVLHSLVALAGLIILNDYSLPGGGGFIGLLLGLAIALCTVIVWTARFGVGLLRSDGRPRLRRHWPRWLTAPIMGVAVIGLVYFDVPSTARFALSESSLEDFARTVASQAEETEIGDTWVGLYPLTSIEPNEGGARFLVSGTGFLDQYGFAWSPKGPPPEESHTGYTHMDGPWYLWVSKF